MSIFAVGSLLGLGLNSYCVQEVAVCWIFFSLAFISLTVVILVGALACGACECVILRVRTAARQVAPKVEIAPPELHLKITPAAGKLK
jgi:hypothetical protein